MTAAQVDVTVIVPVYNRGPLLGRCLQSVAAQRTQARYEVLVVDDCSTDNSADVARQEGARVVRTDRNRGSGAARNLGLQDAAGEWVAFLDSDDWWSPQHLETLWARRGEATFLATSALTLVAGGCRVVGSPWPTAIELRRPADLLAPENVIATSAAMVRTESLREVGGFSGLRYGEDLELWTRLVARRPGRVFPTLTVAYRSHPGQISAGPEMAASRVALFARLGGDMVFSGRRSRVPATLSAWDARPSGELTWLAREVMARRIDPIVLCWLLVARAGLRHRWRLQPRRVRRLSAALIEQ